MQTASLEPAPVLEPRNDRVMAVYGILAGIGGSLFIGLFWSIGVVLLITNNGGLLTELRLQGAWLWLYYAYPFVTLFCAAVAALLYMMRRHLVAVAFAGAPIVGVIAYYFALNLFHH